MDGWRKPGRPASYVIPAKTRPGGKLNPPFDFEAKSARLGQHEAYDRCPFPERVFVVTTTPDTPESLLTVQEAATSLGLSRFTIYAAMRDERIVWIERYGTKLIPVSAVEEYRGRTQPDDAGGPRRGRPRKQKPEALTT